MRPRRPRRLRARPTGPPDLCRGMTSGEKLLLAVERFLKPPVTKHGPWKAKNTTWRAGIFVTQIGIGVDALEDGGMRVHLFTDEAEKGPTLRSLAMRASKGQLPKWPGAVAPVYRRGDKGNREYFGFTWNRNGGYLEEVEAVGERLKWFAAIKGGVGT